MKYRATKLEYSEYSLLLQPESFDLFQRFSGGFGHQLPYNQHVGDTHEGKQEEGAGRSGVLKHPRGKLTDKIGADP